MTIFNRVTGEQATPEQEAAVIAMADGILDDPYAAPELMAWALEMLPPEQAEARLWESVRQQAECRRAQQRQQGR